MSLGKVMIRTDFILGFSPVYLHFIVSAVLHIEGGGSYSDLKERWALLVILIMNDNAELDSRNLREAEAALKIERDLQHGRSNSQQVTPTLLDYGINFIAAKKIYELSLPAEGDLVFTDNVNKEMSTSKVLHTRADVILDSMNNRFFYLTRACAHALSLGNVEQLGKIWQFGVGLVLDNYDYIALSGEPSQFSKYEKRLDISQVQRGRVLEYFDHEAIEPSFPRVLPEGLASDEYNEAARLSKADGRRLKLV